MAIRYLSGINVDNNTLFVDSANDRVGIGTGSPTYKLDVVGEGRVSDAFMAGGAINIDNNLAIQISSAGAGTQRWIGINKNNGYGLIIGYIENAAALNGVGAYIRQVTSDPIHFLIDNATTAMSIVSGGNVLIGTTTDAGYKLRVNGSSYFDAPILCYTGNGYITALTNDGVGSYDGFGYSFLINNTGHEIGRVTGIYESSGGGGSGGLGFWTRGSGTLSSKMTLNSGGTLTLSNYGSGTKTGTPAYNLAVDSSGNVIELPGGVVDGSGTANYVTKWQDANTVTNSQIVDNGTNVGVNNTSPKTKLDINGQIGFGSKSMSMTDTFAAALTINMFDHHGCYVKLTAFGDWSNHSTIAYLGEFFIQASAGGYNEPGIIIRQVDNTGGGDDIQAQILDPAGAGTRDFIIELRSTSASNTPFTAYIQYEVRGQYNSVS